MNCFAILAQVDQAQMDALKRLRPEHYRYLQAHQGQIKFGGPTRTPATGIPEVMIIIFMATDQSSAEAFIQSEPYNRNGCFKHVDVRAWSQVLPEVAPGALAQTITDLNRQ